MTKINLLSHKILIPQVDFIQAVNSQKPFTIALDGTLSFTPLQVPSIFHGVGARNNAALGKPTPITQTLGPSYTLTLQGPQIAIDCSMAWQTITTLNLPNASYDDASGDGISEFGDDELESIGWHATDFDIDYRSMVEHLEAHAKGVLLCIEREEPYHFSGLGFLEDLTEARALLRQYCIDTIHDKIAHDANYAPNSLDSDQRKALDYFGIETK
ncbi:MAG: hypothetical protein KU37_11360 [Sulfuricurvum sp. PC08-66]|nr:MAG: hypothetical protein KU37_11360 [Sulfuricurvum sp. PC08-66]